MSSLPVSMKRIPSRTTEKSGNIVYQIITLSVAMETSGRSWPNFEIIQALMYVIITCKYKKGSDQEQPRKSGDMVLPIISLWVCFFRRSRAANSAVGGPSRLKFELQALKHVIVTCKYEKERMKNSREKVETPWAFFLSS